MGYHSPGFFCLLVRIFRKYFSCHVMSRHVTPRHATSCHVLSRHVTLVVPEGCRYHTASAVYNIVYVLKFSKLDFGRSLISPRHTGGLQCSPTPISVTVRGEELATAYSPTRTSKLSYRYSNQTARLHASNHAAVGVFWTLKVWTPGRNGNK